MPFGGVPYIHQVQAGVDKGGHISVQKIEHDLSRRRRPYIVIADRRSGIYDHHRQSVPGKFERGLFGHEFGTLVGA